MMRDSFIFYKSFYESVKELKTTEQIKIYNAIFKFQFENEEVELKGVSKSVFNLIKPLLQANNQRYLNGKKGGRPKNVNETKEEPKNNLNETKIKPNEKVMNNVLCIMNNELCNMNNDIIKKDKSFINNNIVEIIDYLNKKINSNYKTTTKATREHIKARLNEKYTVDDFKKVIDKKYDEWYGTEMQKYLRPDTLFGTKFESYLNQEVYKKKSKQEELDDLFKKMEEKYNEN